MEISGLEPFKSFLFLTAVLPRFCHFIALHIVAIVLTNENAIQGTVDKNTLLPMIFNKAESM